MYALCISGVLGLMFGYCLLVCLAHVDKLFLIHLLSLFFLHTYNSAFIIRYLEQRDPQMHQLAKAQIKECYEKNKNGDPSYRSLTTSMSTRLRAIVGDLYWKKAQDYLEHFILQKRKEAKHNPPPPTTSTTTATSTTTTTTTFPPPLSGFNGGSTPLPPAIVPTGIPPNTGGGGGGAGTLLNASNTHSSIPTKLGKKKKIPAVTKEQKNPRKKNEAAVKTAEAMLGGVRAILPTGVGIAHSAPTTATSHLTTVATPLSSSSLSPMPPNMKAKDKKVVDSGGSKNAKRKSITKSNASFVSPTKKKQQEPSYMLMESIDHATLLDVKRLPNIFTSKEYKLDVNITEEQKILLYGDDKDHQRRMKEITEAARKALDTEVDMDSKFKDVGVLPLPSKIPTMYNGWGERNIFSVRNAWAKVRLPESDVRRAELEKEASEKSPHQTKPTILEVESEELLDPSSPSSMVVDVLTIENDTTNHVWYNESRAEQDMTLALLSAATEQYLKRTIEGALAKARLRQNLDGVRLWHTLQAHQAHHHAAAAAAVTTSSTTSPTKHTAEDPPFPPPPAFIRLGCDVRRQIALSEGNATKVYQRMEEAISRRNELQYSNYDNERMLLESTSMADFSKKAHLKYAVQKADVDAKRKFAVFGGVDSMEPPLGRVPKEAKVTLQDLAVSALGSRASTIGLRRKRFRAGLNF